MEKEQRASGLRPGSLREPDPTTGTKVEEPDAAVSLETKGATQSDATKGPRTLDKRLDANIHSAIAILRRELALRKAMGRND